MKVFRLSLLLIFFSMGCTTQSDIPELQILAEVGSSSITIQDFIRRAEYTIRPDYCRQSNYIHKKIILNSLISEKLIAIEYESQNAGSLDDQLNSALTGRKEQAMRQVQYAKESYDRTELKDHELKSAYKLAGRTVFVQYLNLPDLELVDKIKELVIQNVPLDSIHDNLWGGSAPKREISWFEREQDIFHKSLFDPDIKKGQFIGPIATEDSSYLVMVINGWKDEIQISEASQAQRWNDVTERLTEQKAKSSYFKWVKELMSGKEISFNPDIFFQYADRASKHFFKLDSVKKSALNKAIWNEAELLDQPTFTIDSNDFEIDPNSILLQYNGNGWTVKDFNDKLRSHPLVFRKRKLNRSEFPEQLRLAIADLFRDEEITNQCYQSGYNKNWIVESNVSMWKHAMLSREYMAKIKSENKDLKTQDKWLEFMNPVIDSLQDIYSDQIEINMDAFESIELTSTDMIVTQRGVPYPIVVPSFPVITTDSYLNYGTKMDP